MSTTPGSLEGSLELALAIADPEERLRAVMAIVEPVDELGGRVRAARREAVRALHAAGRSWSYIGAVLGVSRQRACNLSIEPTTQEKTT